MGLYEIAYLKWLYYWNRVWFARLRHNLKGRVEFGEGCDIQARNFRYRGYGRVALGKGSVIESGEYPTIFDTAPGAEILLGERIFLRCKYLSNVFTAYRDARIEIGDDSGFNGVIITAKNRIRLGRKVFLAWGVSIMDSDLHDLSNTRKERIQTVEIGDYVLAGNYVTILPGVRIGSHCIIGAGSVVSKDIPDHSIAAGAPARVIGQVDDRDRAS